MVLVSQVGEELNLYKELRRKPSLTRGAYFTAIGLILRHASQGQGLKAAEDAMKVQGDS